MATIKESEEFDRQAYCPDERQRKVVQDGYMNCSLYSGVSSKIIKEIVATYDKSESEVVYDNKTTNCLIVLGRDRFSGQNSGYGGEGYSGCASIDLIAGLGGSRPEPKRIDKDFKKDSSRIYLSQMTDIDRNFSLPVLKLLGPGGNDIPLNFSDSKAAIGMRSDHIRIIGLEEVKLVTFHGIENSQTQKYGNGGIELIAGINVAATGTDPSLTLQHMVKGEQLIACLKSIVDKIDKVLSSVIDAMEKQKEINNFFKNHRHISTKAGAIVSKSTNATQVDFAHLRQMIEDIPAMIKEFKDSAKFEAGYFSFNSPLYICSKYNKVN